MLKVLVLNVDMLYRNKIIVIALALLTVYGCADNTREYILPEFDEVVEIRAEVLSEDIGFNVIKDVLLYKNYIIVLAYDAKTGKNVHIYDKRSGKQLCSAIHTGRGPSEILGYFKNGQIDKLSGILTIYDQTQQCLLNIDIGQLLTNQQIDVEHVPLQECSAWTRRVFNLDDGFQLRISNVGFAANDTTTKRFEITDPCGTKVGSSDIWHIEDSKDRFYVYDADHVEFSPDRQKLVIGTSYGAILETYSIGNGKITPQFIGKFIQPSVEFATSDADFSRTILGFNDIYVSGNKIYSSYDGEAVGNRNASDVFHDIAIWSITGEAIKMVKTDKTIEKICYDDMEQVLYAIVSDIEGNHIAAFRGI